MAEHPSYTVADQIAEFLHERGVKTIFGLPGGENLALIEALRKRGIRFLLTHHEAPAAYAADVTGQYTGRPGVCLATVGPGAVNLLAGAAAATLERSPILAITAEVDLGWQPRVTHMQLDLPRLFKPAAKQSLSLRPQTVLEDLHTAWDLALEPPCGAVHLALAPDVAAAPALPAAPKARQPRETYPTGWRADLDPVLDRLRPAADLFLLAGVGLEMGQAQSHLIELAEAWDVPVAVTPKAKGHFPDSHPLYAGCFSAYGDRALRSALERADLILGVGLDGVDFVTSTWDITTPVINLVPGGGTDPVTRPDLTVAGELNAMLQEIAEWPTSYHHGERRAEALRRQIRADLETGASLRHGKLRLMPLISSLRAALPEDSVVTLDVGVFKLVFLQAWAANRPKTLFVANGLSAMGYAVPAALAVKMAAPASPVMAIVGDGALHMYAGELGTLTRMGLPVIVLVIVDDALSLIRLKQLRQRTAIYGTEFGGTDLAALARAYRLDYLLVETEAAALDRFQEAIQCTRSILVEVRVDRDEYDHFL